MSRSEARRYALAAGATDAEIQQEAERQRRHKGTVPFRNMIHALQLCPWHNTKADWVRLAGALHA